MDLESKGKWSIQRAHSVMDRWRKRGQSNPDNPENPGPRSKPKVFDSQPSMSLAQPRQNFLAWGPLFPKSQCSRRGRSPISTILEGSEHQLPSLTSGPSQATCPGQKCHITHKVRKGCQALSHQPRKRPNSELIYIEIVTPSHEIFQWQLPCILTHLQGEARKRALCLLSRSSGACRGHEF